jgi:predicted glutamine amidotransferase
MCRLLGYVSRTPTTLAELLSEDELNEFTELSCKHADGWGMAWATENGVETTKSPDAARTSTLFARTAHEHLADLGLVHLRWATLGLNVVPENTHPFTDGAIAFAHNGSVKPPSSLDALVPQEFAALRQGTTDSERYFLAVLARMRLAELRMADPATALAETVSLIASSLEFSSLNAMIATPTELIAVSQFDPIAEAREAEPQYYQLRYRVEPDAVIVSSSGWGTGWQTVDNGEMLVVDRNTLAVSVRAIADMSASR